MPRVRQINRLTDFASKFGSGPVPIQPKVVGAERKKGALIPGAASPSVFELPMQAAMTLDTTHCRKYVVLSKLVPGVSIQFRRRGQCVAFAC